MRKIQNQVSKYIAFNWVNKHYRLHVKYCSFFTVTKRLILSAFHSIIFNICMKFEFGVCVMISLNSARVSLFVISVMI